MWLWYMVHWLQKIVNSCESSLASGFFQLLLLHLLNKTGFRYQFNSVYLFAKSRLPVRQKSIELATHDHKHNIKHNYKKKANEKSIELNTQQKYSR